MVLIPNLGKHRNYLLDWSNCDIQQPSARHVVIRRKDGSDLDPRVADRRSFERKSLKSDRPGQNPANLLTSAFTDLAAGISVVGPVVEGPDWSGPTGLRKRRPGRPILRRRDQVPDGGDEPQRDDDHREPDEQRGRGPDQPTDHEAECGDAEDR